MDREIEPEVRRRQTLRRIVVAIVSVAAVVFFFGASVEWLRPSLKRTEILTARVKRGAVEATLQANGTVVPLIEQVVSSPVEARILRIGHRAGDRVRRGDEILTLDTAATRLEAERLVQTDIQKENQATQLRLKLEEDVAAIEAQIEQKKLDAEILHYTADQKARLRADGLAAAQETLAAEAAARKSDIELRQLGEALGRARRSRDAQLAASRSELELARRERVEAQRQLELAAMRADRDGVLTWVAVDEGATVRRGDVLARIADLSAYRVDATISDIHAARLAPGMPVHVRLDDSNVIEGSIENIDPRIESGVVKFTVRLAEPADRRLRNNLRADVSVVASSHPHALLVHRGALGRGDAEHAFVVRGGEAVRVPVHFGVNGDEDIEVVDGLKEGDEVVVSDMSDMKDLARVRLK